MKADERNDQPSSARAAKDKHAIRIILLYWLQAAFIAGLFGLIPVWRENQTPTSKQQLKEAALKWK